MSTTLTEKNINQVNTNDWLTEYQTESVTRVDRLRAPERTDEEWRFSPVKLIAEKINLPSEVCPSRLSAQELNALMVEGIPSIKVIFINGEYHEALSDFSNLPSNCRISSIQTATNTHENIIKAMTDEMLSQPDFSEDIFAAKAHSQLSEGIFIHVEANAEMALPIHIVYISDACECNATISTSVLVHLEHGAKLNLIEDHVSSQNTKTYLSNNVTHASLSEQAQMRQTVLIRSNQEGTYLGRASSCLRSNSRIHYQTFQTGGNFVRRHLRPTIVGENVVADYAGLSIGHDQQCFDMHMRMHHQHPNSYSRQMFKSVLNEASTSNFAGRIIVDQIAQKTNSEQTCQSMLLSEDATANSCPQLEIYADDVRCTHGATSGEIDEQALFYLLSRGIPENEARELLLFAFAGEILERIEYQALYEEIAGLIRGKLFD